MGEISILSDVNPEFLIYYRKKKALEYTMADFPFSYSPVSQPPVLHDVCYLEHKQNKALA